MRRPRLRAPEVAERQSRIGTVVEETDLSSKRHRVGRGGGFRCQVILVEETDLGSEHAQKSDAWPPAAGSLPSPPPYA